MKKLITFFAAVLALAGCSSSSNDKTAYEVTCMTAVARFQIQLTGDKIGGFQDLSPTYTVAMPDGGTLTMAKDACVIYKAAKKEAEESNEIDAAPRASPSPSN